MGQSPDRQLAFRRLKIIKTAAFRNVLLRFLRTPSRAKANAIGGDLRGLSIRHRKNISLRRSLE
jgi:hypothetical protein